MQLVFSAGVDSEYDNGVWSRENNRVGVDYTAGALKSPRQLHCGIANHTVTWPLLKIIGGRPAQKGRWPWQVAILNRFKVTSFFFFCPSYIRFKLVLSS
jgi:hypothetical protein